MLITRLANMVQWTLVLGIASLIYFTPVTSHGIFTLHTLQYRSDFVLPLAVAGAALLGAIGVRRRHGAIDLDEEPRTLYLGLALYLTASFAATTYSLLFHHLGFDLTGIANASRTLLTVGLLITAYRLLRNDERLYRRCALAFALPPVLPVLAGILFVVGPLSNDAVFRCEGAHALFSWGQRFQGLTSDPLQFLVNAYVALAFVWVLALGEIEERLWFGAVAALVYCTALLCFALWTQARGGVLVLPPGLAMGALLVGRHRKYNARRWLAVSGLAAALTLGAWASLPVDARQSLALRFNLGEASVIAGPLVNGHIPASFTSPRSDWLFGRCGLNPKLLTHSVSEPVTDRKAPPEPTSEGDQRLNIWRYYARVAVAHPFGVGFNYAQRFYYTTPHESHVTVHNALLLVWMYGGLVGTIGLLMVLWLACRAAWTATMAQLSARGTFYHFGAVTAFAGLLALAVLGDLSFMDFTFWILMAMVITNPTSQFSQLPSLTDKTAPFRSRRVTES